MPHYDKKQFISALQEAGLEKGDIIFGHSNIGFFGFPEESRDSKCIFKLILDAIFNVIGREGTLIVPTFTYSFSDTNGVFDQVSSKGIGGFFAEEVRKLPEAYRSLDPSISVAAIGGNAEKFTKDVPQNAYGKDSFFERLLLENAKVCNMNFDAATTFVHYAERACQVPYRFDKTFEGRVIDKNRVVRNVKSTIWVRELREGTEPVFEPFDKLTCSMGLCEKIKIGRGFIKVMTIQDQFDLVKNTLKTQPLFLTKAGLHESSHCD